MPKRLIPKRGRPTKGRAHQRDDPSARFAFEQGMITKAEFQACLAGNMEVSLHHRRIFNANADKQATHIRTGEYAELRPGRANEILVAQLLGRDPPNRT